MYNFILLVTLGILVQSSNYVILSVFSEYYFVLIMCVNDDFFNAEHIILKTININL